jgi:hypothetical protein
MDTIVEMEGSSNLRITALSAREVFLRHHALHDVKVKKGEKGEIEAIKIEDIVYGIGDVIAIRLFDKKIRPFKIQKIKKSKQDKMYTFYSTTLTKASRWVMPMLRVNGETQTSMKYHSHFINCYVGTKGEGYMDKIYLVYRYSGDLEYQKFEQQLKRHELFENWIDIDKHHVMYVFNMTAEMRINFTKFMNGAYSKFSESYKNKILNFVVNPAMVKESDIPKTITYGVLYKTDEQLKRVEEQIGKHGVDIKKEGLELLSKPDEAEEVYTGDIEIPTESSLEIARLQEEEENGVPSLLQL